MTILKHEIPKNARSFLLQSHENMTYDGHKVDVILETTNL